MTSFGLLTVYAEVFADFGLKDTATNSITHNVFSTLYFTVMTWTTVGYGDLIPHDAWTRFFACVAALNGYALLAFSIVTLFPLFTEARESPTGLSIARIIIEHKLCTPEELAAAQSHPPGPESS